MVARGKFIGRIARFEYRERNNLATAHVGNSISVNYETENSLRVRKFYR